MAKTVEIEGLGAFELPESSQAVQAQGELSQAPGNVVNLEGLGAFQLPSQPASNRSQSFPESVLSPLTGLAERSSMSGRARSGDPAVLKVLGAREGVPFDVTTGVDIWHRTLMSAARSRQDVETSLRAIPGVRDVKFNQLGDPVITILDKATGQPRDILANPVDIEWGDMAALMANAPEIAAGFLSVKGVPIRPGMLNSLMQIGAMATASTMAGTLKSAALQANEFTPGQVDFERLRNEAVGQFALEASLGGLFGVGAKIGTKAWTPFGDISPGTPMQTLRFDARQAINHFARRGEQAGVSIDVIQTPAELTGNQLLARSEAYALQNPGSAGPVQRLIWEREKQLEAIQNVMLGIPPGAGVNSIPSSAAVGRDVQTLLQGKFAPLNFDVQRGQFKLNQAAMAEIEGSLKHATKIPRPVVQTAVGVRHVERANEIYSQFRSQAATRYAPVRSHPLVQGRTIDAKPLAEDAKTMLEKAFPGIDVTKDVPLTGIGGKPLVGPSGSPLTTEETTTETLSSFVEGGILPQLQQLARLSGAKRAMTGLNDLIQLRRDVDDAAIRGKTIAGIPEKRLKTLRNTLTDRIKTGIDELGDPQLRKDYDLAEKFYADNIGKFKEPGIIELFKDEQARGSLGPNQVIQRVLKNTDTWNQYRDFFGDTSSEYSLMKRAFADDVIGHSEGADVVDWKGFSSRLETAYRTNGEIASQVFDDRGRRLITAGRVLKLSGKENIQVDDVVDLLERGGTQEELLSLISAQTRRQQEFKNSLKQQFANGENVKPSKLVKEFAKTADPDELREVMSIVGENPEYREMVRQRALMDFFSEATEDIKPEAMTKFKRNELSLVSATGIVKTFGDEAQQARWMELLGPETVMDLRELASLLAPGQLRMETFKSAGRLAAGSKITQLEQGKLWNFADSIIHGYVMASLYASRPTRKWLGNTTFAPQEAAIVGNVAISSVPFVESLADVYGEMNTANAAVAAALVKESLDASLFFPFFQGDEDAQ